ncbi:hypothetical protein JOD20_005085 [Herpetosiphon giganteus]|nr:hypothetical protein [Herpetosiphon giganteus]
MKDEEQRTEERMRDEGQKSEVKNQKSEVKSQKSK